MCFPVPAQNGESLPQGFVQPRGNPAEVVVFKNPTIPQSVKVADQPSSDVRVIRFKGVGKHVLQLSEGCYPFPMKENEPMFLTIGYINKFSFPLKNFH